MTGKTLGLDASKETRRITSFIRRTIRQTSAAGVTLGLSGGVDSAVVGALCVRALGAQRVFALLMPSDHTPGADIGDARALVDAWKVGSETVPISPIVRALSDSAKVDGTKIARANVEARVRMALLYYFANSLGYLVAGTGDRSESLLGYFTKWGDGGADFFPIAHLYKTQVRALGTHLGLPKTVVEKPASPQLWPGHRASDELPADYDKLDPALRLLFDLKASRAVAAREAGVSKAVVERVLEMHGKTEHKRRLPPSLA